MTDEKNEKPNAADEVQVAKRKRTARFVRDEELSDLAWVLSTPAGRRFALRLLARCGFQKLSYAGPGRGEETAFREGERNIGLFLYDEYDKAKPGVFNEMLTEHRKGKTE